MNNFFPTEQNARQKFWREWRTNFLSSDKNFCFPIADVMAVFELVAELIQDLVERDSPTLPPSQETNIGDVRRFDDDTRLIQSRIYRGDKGLSIQLVYWYPLHCRHLNIN